MYQIPFSFVDMLEGDSNYYELDCRLPVLHRQPVGLAVTCSSLEMEVEILIRSNQRQCCRPGA